MFQVFKGRTADQVWQDIALSFCNGEGTTIQPSRAGQTLELLHSAISVSDPTQRWVTSRSPSINLAFALAEVIWLMRGRNDSAFLNYFNHQLPKYAGEGDTYHGAYGFRLRNHLGTDQLDRAYQALRSKPDSRQIVLQIWDGKVDLPNWNGDAVAPDIPCNIASILNVRSGKLEWMQILRSNDLYRGLPYNFVQFTMLQEIIAGWLELEIGEYNQISNSLHVYYSDLKNLHNTALNSMPANTDSLAFPKEVCEECFKELEGDVETVIKQNISVNVLSKIVYQSKLPEPFRNMLCILYAEGARRRHQLGIVDEVMNYCTNPLYKQLFKQWLKERKPKLFD